MLEETTQCKQIAGIQWKRMAGSERYFYDNGGLRVQGGGGGGGDEKCLKLRAVHVYGTYRTPLLGLGLSSIEPCEVGQATLNI